MTARPCDFFMVPAADDQPPAEWAGMLMLRRFYLAAVLETDGGVPPWPFTLTALLGSEADALERLPREMERYPNARVMAVWLIFDPEEPAQVAAHQRLAQEAVQ